MLDNLRRWLQAFGDIRERTAVRVPLEALVDRYSSCSVSQNTLAITSGGATTAKIATSDYYAVVNGVLVKIANSTNLPALTGITISANNYNVVCFYVDAAGVVTAAAGTQATTIGGVVFPQPPQKKAMVGFLLITNGASVFTGGTTPLDTATTVYFAPDAAFDPTVLIGS